MIDLNILDVTKRLKMICNFCDMWPWNYKYEQVASIPSPQQNQWILIPGKQNISVWAFPDFCDLTFSDCVTLGEKYRFMQLCV